jgi:hydrogenase maturation protease
MARVLIIGYGNPLRGDDGFGWEAAEQLRERVSGPDLEILSLHQLTPELMEPIGRAERVIFIDAAVEGEPGEIRERRVEPAAASTVAMTHYATPEGLLAGARRLYGRAAEGWMITVAGADFSMGAALTVAVKNAASGVAERALDLASAAL